MEVPTIRLYKGGEDIVCNVDRKEHFESLGWSEKREENKEDAKKTQSESLKKKGK